MLSHSLAALTLGGFFSGIGRSLREGFYMFWDTLWALVLGFGLSGAVQAFVSREQMQRKLGGHDVAAVGRASLYGMVSSSCSYAASAMAKSLTSRGADFVASMVFMFASTNLVVELGIVLVVLIGWQFLAAEFIGGVIMIGLLAIAGGLWFRGRALAEARSIAEGQGGGHQHGVDHQAFQRQPLRQRLRSRAGWADAAGYTMSDLTMLRKEMAIGFVVAGFLATLVPNDVWNAVFIHGHGFWTSLENVFVGPFVAIISLVCSVGNVPLAAALWKGGITFGGVISFIFADLIAFPLLLIYRKQYGSRMAVRMLAVFWSVMALAGLATEYLFKGLSWVPTTRPAVIAGDALAWNYTTVLDIVALGAFGGLYLLYRNRERFGGGSGYAKDPVCGMQVEIAYAPASARDAGSQVYFCSEHCRDRFHRGREKAIVEGEQHEDASPLHITDPICGMSVDPNQAAARRDRGGQSFYFCGPACAEEFDRRAENNAPTSTAHPTGHNQ